MDSGSKSVVQPKSGANAQVTEESMAILHDMSRLLNTGLTRDQLAICVELVEQNIHPEAVAEIIKALRKEVKK